MAENLPAGSKHRSIYADHPALKDVVPVFVARLPAHVVNLRALLAAGKMEELRLVAHKLHGAGESFGFVGMTALSAALEQTIVAGGGPQEVASGVDTLIRFMENVEGFSGC
jgi:HPt (histidine-containing phosphotransfer) domain-containing protein